MTPVLGPILGVDSLVSRWKAGGPMLKVADRPRFRLGRPPLMQALVQVQFPQVARLESLAGIEPVQELLQDQFPYMQQQRVQELSLTVGPAGQGVPEASHSIITEFTNDDGWALAIAAGSATLSVGASYDGVDGFAERLLLVLRALSKGVGVRRCNRLGVRYVDMVEMPSGDEQIWTEWFRPELVGWAHKELLAEYVTLQGSVTETRLGLELGGALAWAPAGAQTIVRHGFIPAGSILPGLPPRPLSQPSFVLDLDVFVEAGQRWDSEALVEQYRLMHEQIERIFYWSLTEKGAAEFQLQEIS
jgi:uncharacterized protein (TIGR04255 family)